MAVIDDAFAEMTTKPEQFLRHYFVTIAGGLGFASGPEQIVMKAEGVTRSGFTTGRSGAAGKVKNREAISMFLARTSALGTNHPNSLSFYAYYVAMKQVDDATVGTATTHFLLPASMGPNIMVTSQLSGCMFGIGSDAGGNRLVSHIQPRLVTANVVQRAADLSAAVQSGFSHLDATYAKTVDYTEKATIIGIRRAGQWQIYAQNHDLYGMYLGVASVTRVL